MTATTDATPFTLPVRPNAVPAELRARPQWVAWQWERREEKWTKVPVNVRTGSRAESDNPATWTDFETARDYAATRTNIAGIGYVFSADDPYTGLDFDDCHDPETGELDAWATAVLAGFASYAEVSPSGTGVKAFVRAKLPDHGIRRKRPDGIPGGMVEMYDSGRFFTTTGHHVRDTPATIRDAQEAVDALYARLTSATARDDAALSSGMWKVDDKQATRDTLTDDELIALASRARNGAKFTALWMGSTTGYPSQSEADAALCSLLAFYTGPDAARIDRLFQQSRLMRPKWEERRGTDTYGEITVKGAIDRRSEYWQPGERFADDRERTEGRGDETTAGEPDATAWTPATAPYPEALEREAFYGLPGKIVRAIEPHTESDPAALLLQLLVGTGNLIGRTPTLMMDGAAHHPNLFAILVGTTSKARKGTSWRQTRRVLAMVDPGWADKRITGGLSSGEGLIEAVADPPPDDNPPPEPMDKRLMIQVGEFASVLAVQGREGNTLSAVLRDAWDGDTLTVLNRKANKLRATSPHISMVAHVTRDELLRMLQTTEAANGYANRFLWGAVRRPKLLPRGGNLTDAMLLPLAEQLKAAVVKARQTQFITLTDPAWKLWDTVYAELSQEQAGLLGAITARAEPLVLRLAMIYALMDSTAAIDVPHLMAGCAVWEYCQQSAAWIFGDRLGDPDGDVLLSHLRQRPEGITRTEIHGLFGRNRSAAQVNRALTSLEEKNLARRMEEIPDGDRRQRTERWYVITQEGK